jgi:sporulation protein YlmC with PRC-barrel domain
VTNFYKQNVYDPSDNKIGGVDDILIDKEGRVTAVIIGITGFLGMKRTWLFPSAQSAPARRTTNGNWFSTRTRRLCSGERLVTFASDRSETTLEVTH